MNTFPAVRLKTAPHRSIEQLSTTVDSEMNGLSRVDWNKARRPVTLATDLTERMGRTVALQGQRT